MSGRYPDITSGYQVAPPHLCTLGDGGEKNRRRSGVGLQYPTTASSTPLLLAIPYSSSRSSSIAGARAKSAV
ncbi:unnamed protein product [Sphagnum troendelagicum]|uniref:Uncharacterized protein n=1 Tax=Sphagnum troendelagicum TaxID=128251 RepID=A0ABP0TUC0_9BRYO